MNRNVIKIALALGLAGGATALLGARLAEGHGRHFEERAAAHDQNRDGVLDDAERAAMRKDFEARRAARHKEVLARFDKDGDGQLSTAEREAMMHARAVERFQSMDSDKNGQISLGELEAHMKNHMKRERGRQ